MLNTKYKRLVVSRCAGGFRVKEAGYPSIKLRTLTACLAHTRQLLRASGDHIDLPGSLGSLEEEWQLCGSRKEAPWDNSQTEDEVDWSRIPVYRIGKSLYKRWKGQIRQRRVGYRLENKIDIGTALRFKNNPDELKSFLAGLPSCRRSTLGSFIKEAVRQDGLVEGSRIVSPYTLESEEYAVFRDAERFDCIGAAGTRVGEIRIWDSIDAVCIKKRSGGAPIFIKRGDLKELSIMNKDKLGEQKGLCDWADVLWRYFEYKRDEALGCFQMLHTDTKAYEPHLENIANGD